MAVHLPSPAGAASLLLGGKNGENTEKQDHYIFFPPQTQRVVCQLLVDGGCVHPPPHISEPDTYNETGRAPLVAQHVSHL